MKRKPQSGTAMNGVRSRILTSAKELFVIQGYKKTTIRQIVMKSGVLTGSIYYFFKNKEDIFQALILQLFKQCNYLINKNFSDKSPAFKFAALCLVELKAVEINEWARESYYEGYTSTVIFEKMVDYLTQISIDMFRDTNLLMSKQDLYLSILLIKGIMRSYIAQFYFEDTIDLHKYLKLFIETSLNILSIPNDEINDVLKSLEQESTVIEDIAKALIKQ